MLEDVGEPALKMSYADYLRFEETAELKHEYIDGLVVAMSGGTLEHARLAAKMIVLLANALENAPCTVLSSDGRVRIEATNNARYPDVSVFCGEAQVASDDAQGLANPRVLVEVLSPSTERDDRGTKFAHYRRLEALQEYVLVSQERASVEVFRRGEDGWTLREYGPGDQAELASLGVQLPVDALYTDALSGG
ncbi:MAG: Uma2 family endonuclease [Myxococcota bacterium]